MGIETAGHGTFRLKPEKTLLDVVKLFDADLEGDDLPEADDVSWQDCDMYQTWFELDGDELSYSFGGESFSYADLTNEFLAAAATELAAEAWTHYDTAHDGEDQVYGPDRRAILRYNIKTALFSIETAVAEIRKAEDELAHIPPAAG